ncbi:hypothetical protein QOK74_08060 [Staphylococcus saprophyticus]|uniref:hypothetical protein n=1 Tax=Staphylococcus saprophyticus TaxID=29385 RepID=UPI0024C33685|nr:hypothetical protein [Staphylococcus saprophyticus]MDK1672824.1 hypothetical protein [Staphylococcus saprophyticus]
MTDDIITPIVISLVIILLISLIYITIKEKRELNNNLKRLERLSNLTLSDLHIEKFDKYVDIKMVSGDSFENVSMEEYESINDPMKQGSYRIHRRAIESERHHSLGAGYFEFEGMRINVTIYGDENKNIWKLKDNHSSNFMRENFGFPYISWNYTSDRQELSVWQDWSEYSFPIKK